MRMRTEATVTAPIPVPLITGFPGSGKTTLVNRILAEHGEEKIAVIENEFGNVSIDHALLAHEAEIIEINDGCVCCSVRGDLIRILGAFAHRAEAGELQLDRVLIETTGLADPAPVIQMFFADPCIHAHFRLDAMLTVLDAEHAMRQLDGHESAREKVAFADVLLIGKRDRTNEKRFSELVQRMLRINPRAPIHALLHGDVSMDVIVDVNAFNLTSLLEIDPGFLDEAHHHHHDNIAAFVYRSERAFDEGRLENFMANVIAQHHPDLLRYKGILSLTGEPHQVALQGVHMTVYGDRIRPWPVGAARTSTVVFIGRNLPEVELRAGLNACLV